MAENKTGQVTVFTSDQQIGTLLEAVFAPSGYTLTRIRDPRGASDLFNQEPPSLVILSENLSGGDSLAVAASLHEHFPILPIILLVSTETPEVYKQALRSGVADVLCLPLTRDEILMSAERCLKQSARMKTGQETGPSEDADRLQHRVDELETLAQVGRSITSSLDLGSVLTSVVDAAVALTGAEEGSLMLLDENTGELYMRAARNFQEDFVRTFRLPVTDSLVGSVVTSGKPVMIDTKTPQKIKTSYLVQSLLYVPLQIRNRILGVLGVDNRQSSLPFTEHHVKLLTAMADFAVGAIENARLYDHTSVERSKLETILTRIQDGVIVLDLTQRFLLANQTARQAFNLEDEALIGKTATDFERLQPLMELVNQSGQNQFNRGEIAVEDGRVFGVQFITIPEVGQTITLHDITYLKKLDRLKSDFVTTVSHDLRSPLTAIRGYVDYLDRVGPINDRQKEFIERVQTSITNISELISDLLNLGRIESGFDAQKEVVPLDQILQLSVEGYRSRAAGKGQQLKVNLSPNIPPVLGNPLHLRQMVDNLLDNAIKYTPEDGLIDVNVQLDGKQLVFQVTDSGPGIPPIDLPYIFDKFYRASNASEETPGVGLGLSIVKSVVEDHQGRIWVDSPPGKGATFTVLLPVAENGNKVEN
ncbi:MAG: ATP-binding protein [Chloroflexi bacterium]|nr:ATP-binding protein [Chloroflexota bacterium]